MFKIGTHYLKPDGISHLTSLLGQGNEHVYRDKPLFWLFKKSWPPKGLKKDHWANYACVHKNWKLAASQNFEHVELFDLANDAFEKINLSQKHPEIAEQMIKQIKAWLETLPKTPTGQVFSRERTHPTEISKRK